MRKAPWGSTRCPYSAPNPRAQKRTPQQFRGLWTKKTNFGALGKKKTNFGASKMINFLGKATPAGDTKLHKKKLNETFPRLEPPDEHVEHVRVVQVAVLAVGDVDRDGRVARPPDRLAQVRLPCEDIEEDAPDLQSGRAQFALKKAVKSRGARSERNRQNSWSAAGMRCHSNASFPCLSYRSTELLLRHCPRC